MGYFSSVATIISVVVGAGVLALPFVAVQAGFWVFSVQLVLLTLVMVLLNLFVVELVVKSRGYHHLVDLTRKYLGKGWKRLMLFVFVFAQYGALVAYIVGILDVSNNLFNSPIYGWFIIFGAVFLLWFRLHVVADSESLLTVVMMVLLFLLAFIKAPSISVSNFSVSTGGFFDSFGVILFSLMGFTIIPEAVKELKRKEDGYSVVITAFTIIFVSYFFFTFVFVGSEGVSVKEIVVESFSGGLLVVSSFLVFILLITSFLGLGLALKDAFSLDLRIKKKTAWLLAVVPPLVFYFFTTPGFVSVIGFVGALSTAFLGVIICLAYLKVKRVNPGGGVPFGDKLVPLIILVLVIGALLEVYKVLF